MTPAALLQFRLDIASLDQIQQTTQARRRVGAFQCSGCSVGIGVGAANVWIVGDSAFHSFVSNNLARAYLLDRRADGEIESHYCDPYPRYQSWPTNCGGTTHKKRVGDMHVWDSKCGR